MFEPVGEGGTAAPVDLTNYYTRAEVDEIIDDLPPDTDTGEVNTASNVGAGAEVFKDKVGVDLRFRSLVAGDTTIQIVEDADEIAIYGAALPPGPFKGALVRITANETTTNAAPTVVWDEEVYDTDGFWAVGQPTRLVVPAGITKVRLRFNVTTSGTSDGGVNFRIWVQKNTAGTANIHDALFGQNSYSATAISKLINAESFVISVAEGDYFELFAYSSSNNSLQPLTGGYGSWFAIEVVE